MSVVTVVCSVHRRFPIDSILLLLSEDIRDQVAKLSEISRRNYDVLGRHFFLWAGGRPHICDIHF